MSVTEVRVVLMTVPDAETGRNIAGALVEDRLAACGNVVEGLTSVFRWKGQVQTEAEALVILKTSTERLAAMMERARSLHPYDVPELLALSVADAHAPYVRWVLDETRAGPSA